MERMFLNPMDGEIYPESHYHRENIDLRCVIEAIEMDDGIAFDIVPENLERMEFDDVMVISLIADFARVLAITAMESNDPEEAEQCASVATYVSRIMVGKLKLQELKMH
jgi:hypothetical protein